MPTSPCGEVKSMYLPAHFREERPEVLHAFIERHPLGTLVVSTRNGPSADHIPMLLVRDQTANGSLHGHIARANPLWRDVSDAADVLVIFGGANAYISPSWYPSKIATGKVVPTWNYAVVHVRGRIQFFSDAARLRALLDSLTNHHESRQPIPWAVEDAPEDYVREQLRAVVGFEIEILNVVGKFKASQNRSAEDRAGVAAALRTTNAEELGELVSRPNVTAADNS